MLSPNADKLKILFYHAGTNAWFYPAVLQFKTYIELHYPDAAARLEWLIPIQTQIDDQQLIDLVKSANADLLCTSHYIWNHDFLTKQLERVASKIKKHVKIISGGPSINVNDDLDFFEKYPYIDYAVFAAGEQAIADILIHLIFNKPLIAFNTSNCAWRHAKTNKAVVAEYKFVKMLEISPFVHNEQLFAEMSADFFQKNQGMWFPYTLTRGCPYACTFCDWNSGLGNKVSRRKNTYQQEIDLFQKLGIKNIYLSDANVGQYDEDIDMIEYFAQKNLVENAKFHIGGNFSKLQKENNLKIFNIMARGQLVNKTLNFSVQDIDKKVLENIDRPDVGWDVHVSMANELREQHSHLIVKAQLIYGLPGQTLESWKTTLSKTTNENIYPNIMLNEPLPASPAMLDPEYQRRFQYEYMQSNRIFNGNLFSSLITKKSNSFSQADIVHMSIISGLYQAMTIIKLAMIEHTKYELDIDTIIDQLVETPEYQMLYNNLLTNWVDNNNFYYTIDFGNNPGNVGDVEFSKNLIYSKEFMKCVINYLPQHLRGQYAKLIVSDTFKTLNNEIIMDFD
jgi:hypothetical protein